MALAQGCQNDYVIGRPNLKQHVLVMGTGIGSTLCGGQEAEKSATESVQLTLACPALTHLGSPEGFVCYCIVV